MGHKERQVKFSMGYNNKRTFQRQVNQGQLILMCLTGY